MTLPPRFPDLAISSAISAALMVPSFFVTLHNPRSIPTLSLIGWLFVVNIYRFVNALLWSNNSDIKLLVWCDIVNKIDIGSAIALPSAVLCLCRYLEGVVSFRQRSLEQHSIRERLFQSFMCFGLPVLFMAIHYISQGHRGDIIENIGCNPPVYVSWVSILTLYIPPILVSCISVIYAGLILRAIMKDRIKITRSLDTTNGPITKEHYIRLAFFCITGLTVNIAFDIYILAANIHSPGIRPYISWDYVHSHFSFVQPIPLILIPPKLWGQFRFTQWMIPISSVLVFAVFGTGTNAKSSYRRWFARLFGKKSIDDKPAVSRPHMSTVQFESFNQISEMEAEGSNQGRHPL